MYNVFIVAIFYVLCGNVHLQKIPSYVPICKKSDPNLSKCIINSINTLRPYLVNGIPEMNIPPGDPLEFHNASVETGGNGAVSLKAKGWNHTAYGLMDFDMKDISLNFQDLILTTTVLFPMVRLKGQYQFKGKVLVFDIDATGFYDINATNVVGNARVDVKFYRKNSKEYVEFENITLDVGIETAKINFSDIIKGNPELTEVANNALNENINVVVEELRSVLGYVFGELVLSYFNAVFRLFPINELLPED